MPRNGREWKEEANGAVFQLLPRRNAKAAKRKENAKCNRKTLGNQQQNTRTGRERVQAKESEPKRGAGDIRESESERGTAIRNATLRILCANDKHFRAAIKITVRERERTLHSERAPRRAVQNE